MSANPFHFSFPAAPDWTKTQSEQEAAIAERAARIVRLKQELSNLRERIEALDFKLSMGMISEAEYENTQASLHERIEACEAETKGWES